MLEFMIHAQFDSSTVTLTFLLLCLYNQCWSHCFIYFTHLLPEKKTTFHHIICLKQSPFNNITLKSLFARVSAQIYILIRAYTEFVIGRLFKYYNKVIKKLSEKLSNSQVSSDFCSWNRYKPFLAVVNEALASWLGFVC